MTRTPRWWLRIPGLLACGVVGISGQWPGSGVEAAGFPEESDPVEPAVTVEALSAAVDAAALPLSVPDRAAIDEAALRADPRVRAFIRAYEPLIDSVTYRNEDLVFTVGGRAIHFEDGRMLAEGRLDRRDRCDPIFYRYPLGLPSEPAAPSNDRVSFCSDLQEALWGRTEVQIRQHGRSTTFLGQRMFLNERMAEALALVERDVLALAPSDESVAAWVDGIDITYSFIDRGIAGTRTRSQHAWGLAVDLVPSSYDGLQVYWRWTRAWNPRGWHEVPLEQRWSPPAPVIEIFEEHGFLWGGKWAHFDNIHFEYRPEILEYNRLVEAQD